MRIYQITGIAGAIFFLSACQSIDLAQSPEQPESNVAAVSEEPVVTECLHDPSQQKNAEDCPIGQEGTIPVTHPVEPIDIALPPAEEVEEPLDEAVEPLQDVWERVRLQLSFEVPDNRRIKAQRNWYLRHPSYMQRVNKRAEPFLYHIVERIEQRGMPMELALLPIVESAFDPFAYSHGRAAGMWQFIPGTAKRFGMKQNWWYDGRRDVIASTEGALNYLEYLLEFFDGNWMHALAAYNSGEGRVRRAIRNNARKGKPTDFWSLDLPRETRAYVPKLLALSDILKNHEDYEFNWPELDNRPVIEIVETGSQIDLAFAGELAGLDVKALHALNPGFNRWATDPDGPHQLVLPIDRAESFELALNDIDDRDRLNWVRHKVKRGDSLLKLAKKYHTSVDVIRNINDINGNMIRAGDHIMVPVALKSLDSYTLSADQRLASTKATQRASHQLTHVVRSGDTMWDISREYKVNLRSLAKWNGMAPTDPLMPGKELVIWVNQVSEQQRDNAIMRSLTYTVRSGDSLARIAQKFNVRIADLTKWNQLDSKKYLQPGQKIKVFVDVTRT